MLASMANREASSSSAPFTKSWKYHVVLSFRGEDTRHNFTDHLYSALCQQGINTFRDDDELIRGEEISSALFTAIEESKISVVVFSKNYASSKWCLDELVKILDCKKSKQQLVIPVFYKVNPSDVRNQRGSFGDALANMECKYKENMQKVNKWRAALSQVAALSGFTLDERQSESEFIQNIIEKISKHILNTVCLEVAEHPVGMQAQVQVMNELLDLGMRIRINLASMANQRASSSSASFPKSREDQVFLSFRGEDTRHNFTDHLYSALCQRRINTFRDDDDLGRGEEISRALLTAIEESKISVIVFSKNYASSRWCLDELVKILDCKKSKQQLVIPVFYKVNPSDVRNQRGSFGDALANMECKYKENMPKVNKWRAALSQVAALSGFTLDERQSESKFIQNIIEKISKHVLNTVCLEVAEYPVGMQAQVQVMNELLDLGESDVRMVGVWGTGGIGKTTIAKAVYNSIAHKFKGCSFLANVRERSTSHEGSVGLQENLLSDIQRVKNLKVTNVDKGVTIIKEWLSRRKILLVLDDVDDMEQLHKLVGACDWFGAGSRIIITTRDKQLLTAHDVNLIHEVKILDDDKALELFCWHAFKRSGPSLDDYVKLAESAIRYAQGLPLALKVLGSCLCGGSIDKWEHTLDGFKSKKIQDVLKVSYDTLDDIVKEVFLDIACFFKGKSRNYVIETLEACDLSPRYGIEVLIEKALISVEHGDYIRMHDLLEEMGKDIVEQESPTEAGGRSRLWFHEDVEHVLTNNTGKKKITGIMLNSPKKDYEIFMDVDCFSKMKNLKIFMNYNVCLSGDIGCLPNMLRVLYWYRCPLQSFPPNFRPNGLGLLNLPYSCIKQLWEGLKHFTKLTSLNLELSEFLTEIPDLSGSPNLRYLNASYCESLVEVHPSVGYLDKLQVLDFCGCYELTKFPNKVWWKSLKWLDLRDCIKLESFPEIVDKMESLYHLGLAETAIKELPASIGHLIGLKYLFLCGTHIKELPSSFGHLTALAKLSLERTAIEELPSSIGDFTALEILNLEGCENLANLPQKGLTGAGHVGLRYIAVPRKISLPAHMKRKSDDQLKSSVHRFINVNYKGGRGLFKSYGVHLSLNNMPKDGFGFCSMPEDGDDDENKEELDDDDVGDEVRLRKRKKMTSLCISM
ncbi:PREDICTED: TMV resistance protein N-like [Prunus mume]|uniref:TMV resistance protein N-like n=1 Tax=Prunus mume TaxID=102107 RepID=A0ABM0NNT8_PRUMU|nr:PREDICTED: TMV resistance protein N-like [Prunus mume]